MSNDLSKSLYRAVIKAMNSDGSPETTQKIVDDILDPNLKAQVQPSEIPATQENVLNKDMNISNLHNQKQAQAEAKLGMYPGEQGDSLKKQDSYGDSTCNPNEKGINKLRKFMEILESKKR